MVKFSSQIAWTLWNAQSIPTLSLTHIWSSWHAIVDSGPVTVSTILEEKNVFRFIQPQPDARQAVFQTQSGGQT